MDEKKITAVSALWYTSISIFMAAVFFLLTGGDKYDSVARYGGSVWVFVLTMIITMPIVIPRVKKRHQ